MMIRPAILDDSASILSLRNNPESVFWSGKPSISEITHREWFPKNLSLILVLDDSKILDDPTGVRGYARIDRTGRVSFAVDEEIAGRGYGRQLLLALEPLARKDPSLSYLWAEVHPSNVASMRAFMHAGYRLYPDSPDYPWGRYELVRKDL